MPYEERVLLIFPLLFEEFIEMTCLEILEIGVGIDGLEEAPGKKVSRA